MKVGMTEREWLEGDELWRMLHYALDLGPFPARKQLLFCATACRLGGEKMPADYLPILDDLASLADSPDLPVLLLGETIGDRHRKLEFEDSTYPLEGPLDDLRARRHDVAQRRYEAIIGRTEHAHWVEGDARFEVEEVVINALTGDPFICSFGSGAGNITRSRPEADLLRELLGNLFRPIRLDPAWQASTIQGLARTIYEDRTFDALPILGDALEDVGANVAILDHLRSPGPHVRGCWALDLILGKQ